MSRTTENLVVTVPIGLREQCKEAAAEDGRNLSSFVSIALRRYLEAQAMTAPRASGS